MEEKTEFIPTAYNLLEGYPFTEYPSGSLSTDGKSDTAAFITGTNSRDEKKCIVCGYGGVAVDSCHIIPRVESMTWQEMLDNKFIPRQVKNVEHESRNGITLCRTHHYCFDAHSFYIRWIPEGKCFIFVNQSREKELEEFHGRVVRLFSDNSRSPFPGAFLFHEMRVRGRWPLRADRGIKLPFHWQRWIDPPASMPSILSDNIVRDIDSNDECPPDPTVQLEQDDHPPTFFIPSNPFANPAQLEILKRSYTQLPTWKAAIIEGETWEGNAEENIAKWRGRVGPGEPSS